MDRLFDWLWEGLEWEKSFETGIEAWIDDGFNFNLFRHHLQKNGLPGKD